MKTSVKAAIGSRGWKDQTKPTQPMKTETKWTIEQATALNKLLDLLDDVLDSHVDDQYQHDRYVKRYKKLLDVMFPERIAARNPHHNG